MSLINQTNVDLQLFAHNPWKQATVAITVIILVSNLAIILLALYNQSYAPFKSKQLVVMCFAYLGNVCYILSLLQIYQIVDQSGVFGLCHLWFLWSQIVFGCCLTAIVLAYRMRRLYYLICATKRAEGFQFWLPIVLVYIPTPILVILADIFPNTYVTPTPMVFEGSKDGIPGCVVFPESMWYLYALYTVVLIQIIYLWVLTFSVSRIRTSFNEFRENLVINIICTVLLFTSLGMVMLGFSYTIWGKLILLFMGIVYSSASSIGPLISPAIGFIFHRKEYLAKWKKGLKDESLPTDLAYNSSNATTNATAQSHKSLR
ncbi:hypothetical protein HDV06_003335 [Boothiomyces sp. JEL0866]|nr:hypothetical protein HDV06_003335 [Boothiomyces sp. JEL0866]